VYIQAALHADEPPGMLVAQFLRTRLGQLDAAGKIAGEIILVPAANPIGRAQAIRGAVFGRFDLTTGVNFNRDFKHVAQDLKLSLASLLNQDVAHNIRLVRSHARAAIAALRPATDADTLKKTLLQLAIDNEIVLDLHCDNDAVLHLYAGTPLADAVQPLSALLGAQALLLSRASGGEAFDEACSRLWRDLDAHFGGAYPIPPACMAVTVELRGEVDVDYALAQQDADALLQFLAHQGVLAVDALPLPAALCVATPLEGVAPLLAPHAGVLVYLRQLGERVEAGDPIADLIDPVSGDTTTVRSTVGHFIDSKPQGLAALMMAPIKGFAEARPDIGFVLITGGAFAVLHKTEAIDAMIKSIARAHTRSAFVRAALIPVFTTMFSLGGATFGMNEEAIPFILIFVPLALALGYDSVTGVSIPFVGSQVGFAAAFLNPFNVGIAQGIAGLPVFSGMGYRLLVWTIATGVTIAFLMWYAARIKANPEKSPTYILDQTRRKELAVDFNNVSGSSYQLLRTALRAVPTSRRHSTFIRMAF
jgi:predicted deacylase